MTKKFANLFELLAEAERLGQEIEMCYGDGIWHKLNVLEDSHVKVIRKLFNEGRLRLKPKFKTVEGYVIITKNLSSASTAYLPYNSQSYVYATPDKPPIDMVRGGIIAKITFEVEE